MKHIEIFYGEMGAGKTFRAKELLALNYSVAEFFEGDDVIPDDMKTYISKFLPVPKEVLDNFIYHHFIPEILLRAQKSTASILYVSQTLYRIEHREFLKKYLEQHGFSVSLTEVKVPFIQNIKNLKSRPQGHRWIAYWLLNKAFFQRD